MNVKQLTEAVWRVQSGLGVSNKAADAVYSMHAVPYPLRWDRQIIAQLRKAMGKDAILNAYGQGYYLSAAGREQLEKLVNPK